jgi:hypothetical protein
VHPGAVPFLVDKVNGPVGSLLVVLIWRFEFMDFIFVSLRQGLTM